MGEKIVIYSQEWGVFLGTCMGLGFWSKLDPAGQDVAVCFDNEDKAKAFIATWDEQPPVEMRFVTVTTVSSDWATSDECGLAGLDEWSTEDILSSPEGETIH
jgi:hypothetical protein